MKVFFLLTIVFIVNSCELFDTDEKLLVQYPISNGSKIMVYYVSLGATTNDVIQVRKSNESTPIWTNDNYNYLKSSKLVNDSTLLLVLSDTGLNKISNKFDTVAVDIIQ